MSDFPPLLKEFDPQKNNNKQPEEIKITQSKTVVWTCIDNHHSWMDILEKRIRNDQGCPICFKELRALKIGNYEDNKYSFNYIKAGVANFMLTERRIPTIRENLVISKIYNVLQKGSIELEDKIKNWSHLLSIIIKEIQEPELKKNLKEQYQIKIYENRRRDWKDYGLRINPKSQLRHSHPDMIRKLHPTLNYSKSPELMHSESKTEIWWTCNFQHNYKLSIYSKTKENKGCPLCEFDRFLLMKEDHKVKPNQFWHTLYPGFHFARKVLIDFMISAEKIPSATENKSINRIYKALRNPKVASIWGIANWPEFLKVIINEIGVDEKDIKERLIKSYNMIARRQKNIQWKTLEN